MDSNFSAPNISLKLQWGHPNEGSSNTGAVGRIDHFRQSLQGFLRLWRGISPNVCIHPRNERRRRQWAI